MNLSGRKVKFLKLHGPVFFNGQQAGPSVSDGLICKNSGLRNVSMILTDQGILLRTTGKDGKNSTIYYEALVTTYECAELHPEDKAKETKK
jgi:hypothetical protein